MKAKVYRGDSFRAILDYCFLPKNKKKSGPPRGTVVGCNMAGATPRELAAEFGVARRLKPDIKKPVWHCSLSCPKGEKLTEERWSEIATDYMQMMGFDPSMQYVAVRHQDTDYDHIHIIASRVGLNGKVFKGQWEAKEAIKATQTLEKKHGLTITKGDDKSALKKQPRQSEIEKALRTGQRPPKMVLQDMIDQVLATGPPITAPDFVSFLQVHGVVARPNIASTGKFSGFSFGLEGDTNKEGQPIFYKGSSLGKAYTAAGLLDRGLQYDATRDMPILTGRHPEPAPDYSGEPKIRRKNGGREFDLIVFMRYEPAPGGGQLYRWQSGAPAFIDQGDEITCAGKATAAKIRVMLDLANEKGWTRIELSGPREFQMAAAMEAARRGISVAGDNREIQEIWRQEHDRTAAERARKQPQSRNNRLSTSGPPAAPGCGLRGLHLVPIGTGAELLLQGDARRDLGLNGEVIRDPELRREGVEYGSSIETGPSPFTTLAPTVAGPDTAPAGSPAPPTGYQGPADSPAASPGEPAGDRTIPTGDRRAEDDAGEFDQPGPDFGRPSPAGDHQGATGGTTDRQEGPSRDPEDRPRGVRGGLAALKNAPRRIVGEDHQGPAEAVTSDEERPVRVDQESKPPLPLRYPSPGG